MGENRSLRNRTLPGESKENRKIPNGSGNTILIDKRNPVQDTEEEQHKLGGERRRKNLQAGYADNGGKEQVLLGKTEKRPLALALEEDLSVKLWGQKQLWGGERMSGKGVSRSKEPREPL